MVQQAEKFGAKILMEEVTGLERNSNGSFVVKGYEADYVAKTVVYRHGREPRAAWTCPARTSFYGRGVSTCATCDGFFLPR